MTQGRVPEILAPAGTEEALKAAVNAGCDAIYLGGNLFSARAFAGNFDQATLLRSLDLCHFFGIRIYMTVNTLLKEREIQDLAGYLRPYYHAGLDGVIVQDVGVARVLKQEFPDLPLHASTQMSLSSVYGARLLKEYGFTRVVPARELSLEELRQIKNTVDIELETFVHGAMCYAYSGKCLFSSFAGGRSGNRGRCAQPCRQCYELPGTGRNDGTSMQADDSAPGMRAYLMSMKDLCTLEILPQLIDTGIDSFKIEGRMKNPYYVAATVNAYRIARDTYQALLKEQERKDEGDASWDTLPENSRESYRKLARDLTEQMQDIYNRGGFSTGYYFMDKGPEMIASDRPNHTGLLIGKVSRVKGTQIEIRLIRRLQQQDVLEIRETGTELTSNQEGEPGEIIYLKGKDLKKIRPEMRVFRTRNNALLQEIETDILLAERKIKASAAVIAHIGKPLRIRIGDAEVTGSIVREAENSPTEKAQVIGKMEKTGGTHLELEVSCEMDSQAFVPMSELNQLRRYAMEQFREQMVSGWRR